MSDASDIKEAILATNAALDGIKADAGQISTRLDALQALIEAGQSSADELAELKTLASALKDKAVEAKAKTAALDGVSDDEGEGQEG